MSIDRPVDKRQFYSALSTTVTIGVVSVGLSMFPALGIFGIPLAGLLGEWSRTNGGDLNPRPINTAVSLSTRSSNGRIISPIDVINAKGIPSSIDSPLPTARSITRETTTIDHIDTIRTATVKSPLCNLETAKIVSPNKRNSEMEKMEEEMVREILTTALENKEITASSGLSVEDVSLAVQKALRYQEKDLPTARKSDESSILIVPRTPNSSGRADVIVEEKGKKSTTIVENNGIMDIALSPEIESKSGVTTERNEKTNSISPSPLLFTPPIVKVTPQSTMRSSHMTSTSERPRVRRTRKRSRERI